MKVKEFSNYRAPKRRPWIPVLFVVLVLAGIIWGVRRPARTRDAQEVDGEEMVAASSNGEDDAGRRTRRFGRQTQEETVSGVEEEDVEALPEDIADLMEQAAALRAEDRLQPAREIYQRALAAATNESTRRKIEEQLGEVHIELIFSPRAMPEKEAYLIQRGDQLRLLARRFGTTVALIQRGNNITDPNRIRIGDRLLIFTGDFEIVANKTRRDMVVYLNGAFFKRYLVGTGEFGKTPVGTFVVRDKIKEPSWWPPDGREVPFGHPDNVLGTRWLSIEATGDTPRVRGYGIHGTWEPESIGQEESDGCIRMLNEEVEELYVYIPSGTPVSIEE